MKLLTVPNVCEITNQGATSVRAWIREKRLPAIRLGRSFRIRESDLAVFIDSLGSSADSNNSEPGLSDAT